MGKEAKTIQLLPTRGNVTGWEIVRVKIGLGRVEPINWDFEVINDKETIESWEVTFKI